MQRHGADSTCVAQHACAASVTHSGIFAVELLDRELQTPATGKAPFLIVLGADPVVGEMHSRTIECACQQRAIRSSSTQPPETLPTCDPSARKQPMSPPVGERSRWSRTVTSHGCSPWVKCQQAASCSVEMVVICHGVMVVSILSRGASRSRNCAWQFRGQNPGR
jgi:hypothetical protein